MTSLNQPGILGTSVDEFLEVFPTDEACAAHIFKTRFEGQGCIRCGRLSQWHPSNSGRIYKHSCGQSRSVTGQTVFAGTKIPLRDIFYAMLLFCNFRSGLPTSFLERHLGLSHKAAFRIGTRIRHQMALIEGRRQIGGPGEFVEVGETAIKHIRTCRAGPSRLSILSLGDGRNVTSRLIHRRRRRYILPVMDEILKSGSLLVTRSEDTLNHITEYGRLRSEIRLIETPSPISDRDVLQPYWKQLKRVLTNTYSHQSEQNIMLYVREFEFRFNRRARGREMFWDLVSEFPNGQSLEDI